MALENAQVPPPYSVHPVVFPFVVRKREGFHEQLTLVLRKERAYVIG